LSAENYYENTKKAIELSKLYDVKKFYIVSIFNQLNLNNTDTEFYNYYEDKVNKIINNNNSVNFINTKKYLNSHDKNRLLL
jgi:capsule polysaccharide export protein KpsE/RkpR